MRTLTSTLLALQRVASQSPRVRVLVQDKQPRFTWIGSQSTGNVQGAECVAADGRVVIAALDTLGVIRVRRVTYPDPDLSDELGMGEGEGWGWYPDDYTSVVTDALAWPNGDVALSNNAGTLRLFYIDVTGALLLCRESTDDGVSWGSASTVKSLVGGGTEWLYKLASGGHDDVFWCSSRPQYRYVYYKTKSGGAWAGEVHVQYIMETGGEYENCYGLSAQWDPVASKFALAASLDRASNGTGRVVSCYFDPVAGVSAYQGIVPCGIPMAGTTPRWPCLLRTSDLLGNLWVLTYIDQFTSSGMSWTAPMCILSRDYSHWLHGVPLGFSTTNIKRLNLVEEDTVVFVHCVNEAYKLYLWYTGRVGMEMTEAQTRVLRYRISEQPERGELDVELDNRDGRYDNPGVAGEVAAPMKPLCQVVVEQGLRTSVGEELIRCRPFYLWSVSQVRESGVNLTRIYAVDGWKLLDMWRPEWTIQWTNKTLGWCIAEVASRAGWFTTTFDGSVEWDRLLTYLTVATRYDQWSGRWFMRINEFGGYPGAWYGLYQPTVMLAPGEGVSGRTILTHLLNLAGGVARFGNGASQDVLHCFVPSDQGASPAADHTYNDGEIIAGQYVSGFAWPTRVRVTGFGVGYEGQSVENAIALGHDVMQVLYSSHWTTAAQVLGVADSALDDAAARASGGWLKTRPNVGLELLDVVVFTDSKAGAGITAVKRRVNRLETEYDPLGGVWLQTVYMEAV